MFDCILKESYEENKRTVVLPKFCAYNCVFILLVIYPFIIHNLYVKERLLLGSRAD
jgi:hypothetical protein